MLVSYPFAVDGHLIPGVTGIPGTPANNII